MSARPTVVVVDHADSFTHNLVHALEGAGAACSVVSHDGTALQDLLRFDGIVLSAGPCSPRETVVSVPLVRALLADEGPPLLGVCLGHQCIAYALGAGVARSSSPMHGKVTRVRHDGRGLFADCPETMDFARYNSLTVTALPEALEACAWDDAGQIMALRHRTRRIEGVQFHPESHLSDHGDRLFDNWVGSLVQRGGLPAPRG